MHHTATRNIKSSKLYDHAHAHELQTGFGGEAGQRLVLLSDLAYHPPSYQVIVQTVCISETTHEISRVRANILHTILNGPLQS